MNLILKTIEGLEPIVIQETKSFKPKKILPETVQITANNLEKIKQLRSINKIYILIKKFKFKNKEEIANQKLDLKKYLKSSFVVRCKRKGNHEFHSIEIEKLLGEQIYNKYKKRVDFKNPETIIYVDILNNDCLIGIDQTPVQLTKRDYKVKTTSQTLNSYIAYSLIKFSNWKSNETLLDPFCGSGDIVIEAALSTDKKTKNVKISALLIPSTKALSIAKVKINIQKAELDWLDTSFKKNSVDKIITSPLIITELNKKEILPEYKEFFDQVTYILKGTLTVITTKPEYILNFAKEYKFKLIKEHNIKLGDLNYKVLIFKK